MINPGKIKPKTASIDKYTKKPKTTKQGQWYTEYAQKTEFGEYGLVNRLVTDWTTPKENFSNMTQAGKKALTSLKKFMNNNQTIVFWHNGEIDDACEYKGFHLHLVVNSMM